MDQFPRVHVLQSFQNLVDNILSMDLFQDTRSDDNVEI